MFWDEDIFEELERMRKRIDMITQRMLQPLSREFAEMPIDISETDNEIIVRADLPGFKKDEVSIRATEDSLEIEAEHKEKRIEKNERFYRAERKVGKVFRRIQLPEPVDYENARARMEDGVLTIVLPKKEKGKAKKKIEIE